MTGFNNIADNISTLMRVGLRGKQLSNVSVLLALLMPIAEPIPAWAYDLNIKPAAVDDGLRLTSQEPPFVASIIDSAGNLFNRMFSFVPPLSKKAEDKRSETEDNERYLAEVTAGTAPRNSTVRIADDTVKSTLSKSLDETNTKELQTSHALLAQESEQSVRDSTYTPANNLGTPPNQSELDSPNSAVAGRIKHRAGIANYSFDVPFASLPGRGTDGSVGMTYNSRIWNKTGENPNSQYQFNVDQNWLAPGFTVGHGKLKSHFWSRTIFNTSFQFKTFNEVIPEGYTEPDGTRHQFECKSRSTIPGTRTEYYDNTFCSEYGTTDGTFVKVIYHGSRPISANLVSDKSAYASTYFTLIHSDGSKVTYSVPGAQFVADDFYRDHYPTVFQDRNGNQIQVAYKDAKDNIEYIRDTLGRYIRFYYESAAEKKLVAVTVPGFNGGVERQTVRFYYQENVPLNYQGKFSGSASAPATYRALKYVYFPATGAGYRYDYHPNFGMITKITKLTGMTATETSLASTGAVKSDGATASTTEYTYPNDGSQSPLTDVPKYVQRTDDWQGRTTPAAANTYYDAPEPATGADRTSAVTVKDTDFDVEYRTVSKNTSDWHNGLTKETTVNKLFGPTRQYTAVMARTVYTWEQGVADASGRRIPILTRVDVTNDAGQIKATTFGYDGYNNQTVAREHDFAAAGVLGTELR